MRTTTARGCAVVVLEGRPGAAGILGAREMEIPMFPTAQEPAAPVYLFALGLVTLMLAMAVANVA